MVHGKFFCGFDRRQFCSQKIGRRKTPVKTLFVKVLTFIYQEGALAWVNPYSCTSARDSHAVPLLSPVKTENLIV